MDEHSPEILELAEQSLGAGNFAAKSVRPDQVADYYRAADIFVLGSLKEGFGRVYLEALMHGLPTIGHRHPVIEYVLGDVGIVADLEKPGELADALLRELQLLGREQRAMSKELETGINERVVDAPSFSLQAPSSPQLRWESVRSRFSWDVLRPHYAEMFRTTAEVSVPEGR
jgi:glycosyltransferase involved in cell wall biosynthesis